MRPTLLEFRSVKEKTPFSYHPRSTYDGRSICFSSPKGDRRKSSFSKERRFIAYDILAQRTGYRVGPGTYNLKNAEKIKSGCPYKDYHLKQKTENNGYFMVGNTLEFEPALMLSSKKKLLQEKELMMDSTYISYRVRSADTTNQSLTIEKKKKNGKEIIRSSQLSPRTKKKQKKRTKRANQSFDLENLIKKRFT